MRGIKSDALSAIVEFLYHGEVCIRQEDLNNFLVLAEELKLKGIVGRRGDYDKLKIENKVRKQDVIPSKERNCNQKSEEYKTEETDYETITPKHDDPSNGKVVIQNDDLNQRMFELIVWNGETWKCTVCVKISP